MVANMAADMEVDKVANMVAEMALTQNKLADMELDMVADMEVDKMADMEVDKVADMAADMFKIKCIKPEMF